jgi:hypothetical protein
MYPQMPLRPPVEIKKGEYELSGGMCRLSCRGVGVPDQVIHSEPERAIAVDQDPPYEVRLVR